MQLNIQKLTRFPLEMSWGHVCGKPPSKPFRLELGNTYGTPMDLIRCDENYQVVVGHLNTILFKLQFTIVLKSPIKDVGKCAMKRMVKILTLV